MTLAQTLLDPPGFDLERRAPVCDACARARAPRWACRLCGTVVCEHEAPVTYLDGGARCRYCERWYNSAPVVAARLARMGLSPPPKEEP